MDGDGEQPESNPLLAEFAPVALGVVSGAATAGDRWQEDLGPAGRRELIRGHRSTSSQPELDVRTRDRESSGDAFLAEMTARQAVMLEHIRRQWLPTLGHKVIPWVFHG